MRSFCFQQITVRPPCKFLSLVMLAGLIVGPPSARGQTTVPSDTLRLSLSDAVKLALQNNLQAVVSKEQISQAKGEKGVGLSALLPNLSGVAYQANATANLASIGFPISKLPGLSPFTGDFNRFDARFQLVQTVFNLAAIRRYQTTLSGVTLARERERLATQQVTAATAISYLAVLEAEEATRAAQSNVQLAETLLSLATNQRRAGIAAGIDVARAETRLANQKVRLAQARTGLDTARLDLLRMINGADGPSLASNLTLTDRMRLVSEPAHEPDQAVSKALADRAEVAVAEQELRIAGLQRRAAGADLLPSVSMFGDYGSSGLKPNDVNYPTRSIGVRVDVPIFNGGRTRAEMQVAASRQRESNSRLRDTRAAVEKDVRQALLTVKTREEQVLAAQTALDLATRELTLAQDRFKNGVADNIEVVNAQTALEDARQTLVSSLAEFNVARLNLVSALGHVEDFRL